MNRLVLTAVISILASAVPAKTVRSYYIGNSVTDQIRYDGLRQLAESRGYTNRWGRQVILGSPLDNIWNNPASGFQQPPYGYPTNALVYYDWDAWSLQPFDRSLTSDTNSISKFIGLALARNSNAQLYVYSRWPRQGNFLPDYDTTWVTNSGDTASGYKQECRDFFEKVTRALRDQWVTNLALPIRIVPCGDVLYALSKKMKAGQVPGMTDIAQVYSDGIHFNDTGMYVVGCTFFSTMYKESPIGLTAAPYSLASGSPLVAIIQTTVWDVVSTHQYAGIIPEILPMSYEVDVPEGGATGIKVRLTDPPAGVTTVHVARIAGDTDISVSGGAELVFTPVDYGTWQTVTLAAGEDADFLHTSATIECSGAGVASCRFEATETDNDASAVCYDPFNATPRVMQDLKTGYGWNGGWAIESGSNGVGYKVVEGNLEYGGLVVKGRKAEGGHSYQGVGRSFDLVSSFLPWVSNMGGSFIGKDGTELWMSYLCRIASTNHNGKMWLDDSNGGLFHDNSGILRVNTVYVPGQGRVWMLSSIAGAFAVTSSVPVTTNVNLMVLRLEFGAEADQIELFANPVALGGDAPAVPDATLVVATNRFKFADMGWNPHNAAAQGWIDEIRFGNSFANVTPLTQQVFTNNNNIVVSGVVENDMRNGYTIIFTGAINGTGTFVTTDGVTNSFVGNVTPGFSPGELAIDRGNGVVNLGLPDDSLMLNIENGDLLVLTNFPGPVDLSAMDVTFYSPTTLGTTNWFLYSTSGFAGEFHDTNYVLYTYGAVIYDGANNRVGVLIVPEPAAALALAGCALARLTRVRRRRG